MGPRRCSTACRRARGGADSGVSARLGAGAERRATPIGKEAFPRGWVEASDGGRRTHRELRFAVGLLLRHRRGFRRGAVLALGGADVRGGLRDPRLGAGLLRDPLLARRGAVLRPVTGLAALEARAVAPLGGPAGPGLRRRRRGVGHRVDTSGGNPPRAIWCEARDDQQRHFESRSRNPGQQQHREWMRSAKNSARTGPDPRTEIADADPKPIGQADWPIRGRQILPSARWVRRSRIARSRVTPLRHTRILLKRCSP